MLNFHYISIELGRILSHKRPRPFCVCVCVRVCVCLPVFVCICVCQSVQILKNIKKKYIVYLKVEIFIFLLEALSVQ